MSGLAGCESQSDINKCCLVRGMGKITMQIQGPSGSVSSCLFHGCTLLLAISKCILCSSQKLGKSLGQMSTESLTVLVKQHIQVLSAYTELNHYIQTLSRLQKSCLEEDEKSNFMATKHLINLLLSPFVNALIVFGLDQCNSLVFSLPLHLFVKTNFPFLYLPFLLPFPLPSSSFLLPLLSSLHSSLPIFSPFSKRLLSTYHLPGDIQEVYT